MNNQIYIYPTDTVWGIGCNIHSEIGFRALCKIKKTTEEKPLSILFQNLEMLRKYLKLSATINEEKLLKIMSQEVTLLIPSFLASDQFSEFVKSKSEFISIRVVRKNEIEWIFNEIKAPIFTTSLNLTKDPPITSFYDAFRFKEHHAPDSKIIFFGDNNLSGRSSTILKLCDKKRIEVIRPGGFCSEDLNQLLELNLF